MILAENLISKLKKSKIGFFTGVPDSILKNLSVILEDLKKQYQDGIGWGDAKNLLFESLHDFLTPFNAEYENIIKDKSYVESVLIEGATKAKEFSQPLIEEIRKSVGIKGF